ncbi:MAG: vWA domain-containing protein [Gemmatimonadota bacterium]
MSRVPAVLAMLAIVLGAGRARAVSAQAVPQQSAPAPLRLVRCARGSDQPCLVTSIALKSSEGVQLSDLDSVTEARSWTGDLAGRRLLGPGVAVAGRAHPPVKLLVLLDRSGSMIGEGIAFTRLTLKAFLEGLDSASVRVAVAGFESRDVVRGIQAATFVPPAAAARELAALASPDSAANTALYSALVEGSRLVTAAAAADSGSRGAILFVTDGVNDVGHKRDDAGLLAGPDGLAQAAAALTASGHRVWIMGVGRGLAMNELRTLAGPEGDATAVALDPNALAARLSVIARELRGTRDLTFGVRGNDAAVLARAPWRGIAAAWRDGRPFVTRGLSWQPPMFAMPAYQGVAAAAALPPAVRENVARGAAGGSARELIGLLLAIVGGALWFVVPRYVWMRRAIPAGLEAAITVSAPRTGAAPPAVEASSLRRDVQEVPPRKATDVTAEFPIPA